MSQACRNRVEILQSEKHSAVFVNVEGVVNEHFHFLKLRCDCLIQVAQALGYCPHLLGRHAIDLRNNKPSACGDGHLEIVNNVFSEISRDSVLLKVE